MARVLVTGGGGFVGANLVRRLLANGDEVHLLLRSASAPWRLEAIASDVAIHPGNLSDRDGVEQIVRSVRPGRVFHLAAHGAYSWQTDHEAMIATNIRGTLNLVQAAVRAEVETLVNTGSSSEYGYKDHAPSEDELIEPNSHYAITKATATLLCRHTARETGIPMPTLRLYSVYGPWEEPGRLVPALLTRALQGEWPPLVAPDTARDYVYVADAVDAYLLAATKSHADPGAVYNVGSGVQTSLREIVETTRSVLEVKAEPEWGSMPGRSWDTDVWVSNPAKIRESLGWQARMSLADGLRETANWFRAHPEFNARYQPPR